MPLFRALLAGIAGLLLASPAFTAPSLTITAPAAGSVQSAVLVTVTATAADFTPGRIELYEFEGGGGAIDAYRGTPTSSSNGVYTWKDVAFTDKQPHTIYVVSGSVTSPMVTFSVDTETAVLQSFTLSSPRVSGCAGSVTGAVTLSKAAGAGGASVTIIGTTPYTDAPGSVIVPAGMTSATFSVTGKPVAASQTVTLTAEYGGVQKTQDLTVDPAARYPYRVEMIPDIGGTFSSASGINARGQVTGTADTADDVYHAFRTDANLRVADITPAVTLDAFGIDINDAGQVVGDRVISSGLGVLIRVEPDGALKDYTPSNGPDTYGQGINSTGQMTGYQYPGGGSARAYRTTAAGVLTLLGTRSGGTYSLGFAINASGQVAGMADDGTSDRAFRTTTTGGVSTATILGPAYSGAYAMNDAGVITGETYSATDGLFHVLRATSATQWEDLGTIPGYRARGEAINGRNEIVGDIYTRDAATGDIQSRGAILYTDAEGLRNLNDLIDPASGWFLAAAYGINDAGQIVGEGLIDGVVRGFRLTPNGAPFPYGDANRDGSINYDDVKLMLQAAGGLATVPDLLAADIAPVQLCSSVGFGDGKVDLQDALRLARRLSGLEPQWP